MQVYMGIVYNYNVSSIKDAMCLVLHWWMETDLQRCPCSTREVGPEWSRHTGRQLTDPQLDVHTLPAQTSSSPQLDGTLSGRQMTNTRYVTLLLHKEHR